MVSSVTENFNRSAEKVKLDLGFDFRVGLRHSSVPSLRV